MSRDPAALLPYVATIGGWAFGVLVIIRRKPRRRPFQRVPMYHA